jgi:hypothetical protein
MRVIECNFCGEVLSAANDGELRTCVARHMSEHHSDEEFDDEALAELVERKAYTAMDS